MPRTEPDTSLPPTLPFAGREVLLKYHMLLSGSGRNPANSLPALDEVLRGAAVIEFDVNRLADGHWALIHDATLQRETSGSGPVARLDRGEFERLTLRDSDIGPCVLADVVARLLRVEQPLKIQVDFKEKRPLSDPEAGDFLEAIAPLREHPSLRVVVGCLADWNLRTFRRLDPELPLGLDFAFHLDGHDEQLVRLPTRINAYGYWDDHPLGFRRLQPVAAYLRDRVETLLGLVPDAAEFYLHASFVMQALDDGFDAVGFVHERLPGALVDVWTLDAGSDRAAAAMRRALEVGADQITTNTALQWYDLFAPAPG